ncbi:MAG: substrate-binding domain-containing protein [Eubacteriales bacterium]|nr:substrate-binding domain-containing protein [Eubacteriales bacterium]
MAGKVTLKQIAEQAGVSLTSVHRVLNGKGGCSEAVTEKILRIAQEQGYSVNVAASTLKKQPMHIALIFPLRAKGGKYFLNRILEGYLTMRDEINPFNIIFQEFYTNVSVTSEFDIQTETILRNIYNDQPVHYDGVLVYGLNLSPKAEGYLNRIVGKGTKVVVLEKCSESLEDICKVVVNDAVAGSMAAELMSKFIYDKGSVLVFGQNMMNGTDMNSSSFCNLLSKFRPELKIVEVPLNLDINQEKLIEEIMRKYDDIQGVYCTCARHTASLLKTIEESKLKPKFVIGSELFDRTYEALNNDVLDAVIDKRPHKVGYKGLQLLIANLLKNEPLPALYQVMPRIILKANCNYFYDEIKEKLYGEDS